MAAMRKSQLYSILSKWCHQMLFSSPPNCSTITQISHSSSSSPQNSKSPVEEHGPADGEPVIPGLKACCDEGCANCVWLDYVIKVIFHFKHNEGEIQKALNRIPDPEKRAFVEFELKRLKKKNMFEIKQ